MSIKSGQILHDVHGFVVDRIQTGGVTSLSIPETKIYELGNYQTVATVRDIPDLSFDVESLDVSTEIESLLLCKDPTAAVDGDEYDFVNACPISVISPFKTAKGLFSIVRGIIVPYLTLESATYRFGMRDNATQAFTLRGDAVYYVPGSPYFQEFTGNGVTTAFTFAHTALAYSESGNTIHALSVDVLYSDGTYKRLFYGDDYTDTSTTLTLVRGSDAPTGSKLKVTYGSAAAATYNQSVHQDTSVKPAAVRGKDIDVYIGNDTEGTSFSRWTGVQSAEASRRVNLDNDEEFGNSHYVSSDYDTADVTGSITVRPRDVTDLFNKVAQVANVSGSAVVGALSSVPLPMEIRVSDPDTGDTLKTLYVPDARFQAPGVQGRVQQKTEVTFNFTSDSGQLLIYKGDRPA